MGSQPAPFVVLRIVTPVKAQAMSKTILEQLITDVTLYDCVLQFKSAGYDHTEIVIKRSKEHKRKRKHVVGQKLTVKVKEQPLTRYSQVVKTDHITEAYLQDVVRFMLTKIEQPERHATNIQPESADKRKGGGA